MKPYEIPEPCTHPRPEGTDYCDKCERARLDASIKRAEEALKQRAKAKQR